MTEPYDKDQSLSTISAKYLDRPFGFGQAETNVIDCLGLCHAVLTDMGKTVPREFKGFSLDRPEDYQALMQQTPEEAYRTLIEMAGSIGEEINPAYKMAGDALIIGTQEKCFAAIYLGNGHAISSFTDIGVSVIPVLNEKILMARRF
jgi:cell wall-associated NlpC family hydrolase